MAVVDLDRRLAKVAVRQHSLISLADVRAAGGTRSNAHARVRSGRWELVHEGVFRISGVPWTYEARVMALVLSVGPGAAASHACAARLLGLGFTTAVPEVSVPRDRKLRRVGVRVHRSTDLDRCEVRTVDGIPVTEPARTLLDLGRYIGPQALRRAVEQARRLRLVIASGLASDEVTDTDSELMALTLIRERGLPEPVLHHRVYEGDTLLGELDLAYVHLLVGLEIDGAVHIDPDVRRKDDARDHELRRRGWTVRRIWWEIPVRQPELFLRIVCDTIRDAESSRVISLRSSRRNDPGIP